MSVSLTASGTTTIERQCRWLCFWDKDASSCGIDLYQLTLLQEGQYEDRQSIEVSCVTSVATNN